MSAKVRTTLSARFFRIWLVMLGVIADDIRGRGLLRFKLPSPPHALVCWWCYLGFISQGSRSVMVHATLPIPHLSILLVMLGVVAKTIRVRGLLRFELSSSNVSL